MYSDRAQSYLADIVDDADRITSFVDGMNGETLAVDERTLLAVERLFQRSTEAVIQVGSADMALIGPELPIKNIRDFGNRLRHDYRNIDPVILIGIARKEVPALRAAAARALEN